MASHEEDGSSGPVKVFLWVTARSCSTSFLKCMTGVPDTSAWYEPYVQMAKFSVNDDPLFFGPFKELVEKLGGKSAIEKIDSGFDASDKTIDWLKEQLEGDFAGKKLVFVKDMGASITRPSPPLYDLIPKGFRHTFLMRHPSKVFNAQNFIKQTMQKNKSGFKNPNKPTPDKFRPYQYLHTLWKYVKEEGLESRPIIIDADDLLRHPKQVIEAYCKEIGIPFSEDILTWEAGDEIMKNQWVVPKQTILTYPTIAAHDTTFSNTGFTRPVKPEVQANNSDQDVPQETPKIPPEALAKAQQFADAILTREIPFYEEMYAERLVVDVDTS